MHLYSLEKTLWCFWLIVSQDGFREIELDEYVKVVSNIYLFMRDSACVYGTVQFWKKDRRKKND